MSGRKYQLDTVRHLVRGMMAKLIFNQGNKVQAQYALCIYVMLGDENWAATG